ncbi:MAG TPA: hypothetical protein VGR27_03630 [Longimicrobiaceae bacterium]|nr:hypothetical protein [Longimicrobiaceae bacterium]
MRHRNVDPAFDDEEIENEDPFGEEAFEAEGFVDAPDGGPAFSAPGLADDTLDKRPGGGGQKVAGIPEERQHELNTPSEQRPDTEGAVIRERGGQSKGDPAVGGTRPE